MNIVFIGTSGVHHPLIAANIFLDRLREPDFRFTRGFADTVYDESGFPIYIGEDQQGNRIYSLGVGTEIEIGRRSIEDLRFILGCSPQELVIKPVVISGANLIYYLAKVPKFIGGAHLNNVISSYIIKKDFGCLKAEVERFKEEIYH